MSVDVAELQQEAVVGGRNSKLPVGRANYWPDSRCFAAVAPVAAFEFQPLVVAVVVAVVDLDLSCF